jgi:hypothetical protein
VASSAKVIREGRELPNSKCGELLLVSDQQSTVSEAKAGRGTLFFLVGL